MKESEIDLLWEWEGRGEGLISERIWDRGSKLKFVGGLRVDEDGPLQYSFILTFIKENFEVLTRLAENHNEIAIQKLTKCLCWM